MATQKILQADVNYLSKRLTQKKTAKEPVVKRLNRNPFAYVETERKIVPYDRNALTKQYYLVKELVADYIDKKQIELFDAAIGILDRADINKIKLNFKNIKLTN